jgi:hypothetical protein
VADRSCTTPAEVREEGRHSVFYSNTQLTLCTLWILTCVGLRHLLPITWFFVPGSIYSPNGPVVAGGVLVGERDLQCSARRCGHISRCGWPYDFHHLWSWVSDLVPETIRRWLWVGLLSERGATGPLGVACPGPPLSFTPDCALVGRWSLGRCPTSVVH